MKLTFRWMASSITKNPQSLFNRAILVLTKSYCGMWFCSWYNHWPLFFSKWKCDCDCYWWALLFDDFIYSLAWIAWTWFVWDCSTRLCHMSNSCWNYRFSEIEVQWYDYCEICSCQLATRILRLDIIRPFCEAMLSFLYLYIISIL